MQSVAIVGVGLIGGSFGLALRAAGFTGRLLGVSRPETLAKAVAGGAIDEGGTLAEMVPRADVVFLSQPIAAILETIDRLGPLVKPGALVTDAGSTKRVICERAAGLPRFVGGHPMAGKESQGVESAEAGFFGDVLGFLTGDPGAEFTGWLERIGARLVRLSPEEHDAQVARSSHLPQLLSTTLASMLEGRVATSTAGPGLESMTRLALSSHALWRDILATNEPEIAAALGEFAGALAAVRGELGRGELAERFVKRGNLAFRSAESNTVGRIMLKCLMVSLGLLCLGSGLFAQDTIVRFKTSFGDIDVQMFRSSAPLNVENFLGYVTRGDYSNTIIHRSVAGFVVQGGGYNTSQAAISSRSSVRLEYREANARGTLAMARGDSINSATNQWFFNTVDNTRTLGSTNNGGYTVIGKIVNSGGLAVMDRMAAVPIYNFGAPFDTLPLQNYRSGNPTTANYVVITSVSVVEATQIVPTISDGGVVTASGFGGFTTSAPGSWLEIYGTNFGATAREWAGSDFTSGRAPTSLNDVSVTIGGQPAFVRYVSAGQLNVQVPTGIGTGGPSPVVVTSKGVASAPMMIDMQETAPGLFAPPAFKYNNAQFVAPVRPATGALINSVVPGIPFTDAIPGETLLFYGVGFGRVTPDTPLAGQVVTGTPRLVSTVKFKIGGVDAAVTYAGLVAGSLGLYQFNVVVPPSLTRGDVKVEVEVDGQPLRQPTLYLPMANPPAQ